MRYFASHTPDVPLFCGSGPVIKWPQYSIGMLEFNPAVPDQAKVIKCLEKAMASGVGGEIEEVTSEVFREWQKKTNGQPQSRRVREELSEGSVGDTVTSKSPPPRAKARAAAAIDPIVPPIVMPPTPKAVPPDDDIPTIRAGK